MIHFLVLVLRYVIPYYNDFKIITAEHGIKFSRDAITSLISDETKTSIHILNYNKNTNKVYNSKLSGL